MNSFEVSFFSFTEKIASDNNAMMLMKAKINFYKEEVGKHSNIVNFLGSVEDPTRKIFVNWCFLNSIP